MKLDSQTSVIKYKAIPEWDELLRTIFISGLLLLVLLSGCNVNNDAQSKQEKIDQNEVDSYAKSYQPPFVKNDTLSSVTGYFSSFLASQNGITVTLTSDKEHIISSQGSVTPSTTSDEIVNLTFLFRKGMAQATKQITVTVPQMGYPPQFSEIVGTWKRSWKTTYSGSDEINPDDDYTETVSTELTITADSEFIRKDTIIKTDATGVTETRFEDFKGFFTGRPIQSDYLCQYLTFNWSFYRSSNLEAFTDDTSGWLQCQPGQTNLYPTTIVCMYKDKLCMDIPYQRINTFHECQNSLPSVYSDWGFIGGYGQISLHFFEDDTVSITGKDDVQISEGGTYTKNADHTLTIRYKNLLTGKQVQTTSYYQIFFSRYIQTHYDGNVTIWGRSYLYSGELPFGEAMYTRQKL